MKRLFVLSILCASLGLSCDFPQRTQTFIPPTNERDLCKTDSRFYYSPEYDFCFRYASNQWTDVFHTGDRETGITSTTANTFYTTRNGERVNLFVLYVGPSNESTKTSFTSESIIIAHEHSRFLIGYHVEPGANDRVPTLVSEIPATMESLFFFSPDGTRQPEERSL